MPSAEENHRNASSRFATLVERTTNWDVPTPVKEWTARQVVEHLLEWFPDLLASGSAVRLAEVDTDDLVTAWRNRADEIQHLLDDSSVANGPYRSRMFGELTIGDFIDRFYTPDIVMHSWDLARATGQDDTIPADFVTGAYEGMSQMADAIRSSGQFGDQQPVAPDATPQDRFIAFIGRDPSWRPPN